MESKQVTDLQSAAPPSQIEMQKKHLYNAISEYAQQAAGTLHDLDEELEAAAIEHLSSLQYE